MYRIHLRKFIQKGRTRKKETTLLANGRENWRSREGDHSRCNLYTQEFNERKEKEKRHRENEKQDLLEAYYDVELNLSFGSSFSLDFLHVCLLFQGKGRWVDMHPMKKHQAAEEGLKKWKYSERWNVIVKRDGVSVQLGMLDVEIKKWTLRKKSLRGLHSWRHDTLQESPR